MEVKCPVSGCEDSEKEFKTEAALKSRTRNIHPDFLEEKDPAKEVPIVEKDFTTAQLVKLAPFFPITNQDW
ncbi:unnamed protein product [marine sediment metagenome]|uniref:Uncharacterized protein n=1 Tax=marine sediment metagenome TaxID=412755 RepID=X1MR74_9ZZZZ